MLLHRFSVCLALCLFFRFRYKDLDMPWPVEMPCNFTFDSFRHKTVTESGGCFIVVFQTCRVGLKTSLLFLHIKICMYLLTNFSLFL